MIMEDMRNKITREGYNRLRAELDELLTVKRKEVAEKLKEARAHGDLSENAEYDAAKNEQAEIEAKISKIESELSDVVIVGNTLKTDLAKIGLKVRIKNIATKSEKTVTLVGRTEADPASNKVSSESPIGMAIIGKPKGEIAPCVLPNGKTIEYKIMEIKK
jgi:transcription elongation factor GreA